MPGCVVSLERRLQFDCAVVGIIFIIFIVCVAAERKKLRLGERVIRTRTIRITFPVGSTVNLLAIPEHKEVKGEKPKAGVHVQNLQGYAASRCCTCCYALDFLLRHSQGPRHLVIQESEDKIMVVIFPHAAAGIVERS